MGLEENQPHDRAGKQQLPAHGQQAVAGNEETVGSHPLDPALGDNVPALRAVLKVSQAVLGAHRLGDALEVIAEHTPGTSSTCSSRHARTSPPSTMTTSTPPSRRCFAD